MFIVLAILLAFGGASLRAEKPHRINGVIEKLARGEVVLGTSPADLSLTNAAVLADSPLDFVQIDMSTVPWTSKPCGRSCRACFRAAKW